MSKKVFVLDTNVLLVDPFAIDNFQEHIVVVSMTVMEELDQLKKRSSTEYEARQAINTILDVAKNHKPGAPFALRNGGTFILDSGGIGRKILAKQQLDPDKPDNRIIATAMRYKEDPAFPDRVVIVSNDSVVRIKAHSVGIASEEYTTVNYRDDLDELYHEAPHIDVDASQFQTLQSGIPVGLSDTRIHNQPVLVRSPENDLETGYVKASNVYLHDALESELLIPLNIEQALALQTAFNHNHQIITITGQAGTGKTLIAMAVAIQEKFLRNRPGKVYIFRPNDQLAKDLGYLPGSIDDKFEPHKRAIRDAYEVLQKGSEKLGKNKKLRDFDSLTNDDSGGRMPILPINFIRGSTLHNAYIIIDEAQNFTPHQMKTILTRAGQNTRIFITGDPDQIDNRFITRRSCGLTHVIGKLRDNDLFAHVHLTQGERSKVATLAANLL